MRRILCISLAVPMLLIQCSMLTVRQQSSANTAPPDIVMRLSVTPPTIAVATTDVRQAEATASPTASDASDTAQMAELVPESTDMPAVPAVPTADIVADVALIATDDMRNLLLDLHNRVRADVGMPAYRASPVLGQAAQQQADYLASLPATELMGLGVRGHLGPDGATTADRASRFGYTGRRVCENWAYFNTVQEAFDFWLTDPWHRPQVLSAEFTEVGFGIGTNTEFGIVFVAVYGWQ